MEAHQIRYVDLIVDHFGPTAAAYVLSVNADDLPAESGGEVSLAIREAARSAWQLMAGEEFLYHDQALAAFVRYDAESGTVVANEMRRATGGDLPPVDAEDRVEAALLRLARDAYPGLVVLRRWEAQQTPTVDLSGLDGPETLRSVIGAHPATAEIAAAVRDDPLLGGLVSGQGRERVFTVNGAGQRLEFDSFAYLLVGAAAARILSATDPPGPASFIATASDCLEEARALARGQTMPGRTTVGIAGITLSRDTRIQTPWGVLRPASGWEAATAPHGVHAQVVLDSDVAWTGGWSDAAPTVPRSPAAPVPLPMPVLLPVALVLALGAERPVRPALAWQRALAPLSGLGWSGGIPGRIRPQSSWMGHPVEQNDADEIETWCAIVQERLTDRLLVSALRLPSACHRSDMGDALIDALIVWENLVGGSNDTTHRVTGGMAVLTEPDPTQVETRQRELELVYEARSAIVHGQANPRCLRPHPGDPWPIATQLNTAIRIAVLGLRALLTDHRHLIPMRSSKRSDRLLRTSPLRDVAG
jgi:hypothetical protein